MFARDTLPRRPGTGCGQLVGKRPLAVLSRALSCDTMLVYDAESILP
jgi:hypothetical protein